MKTILDWIWQTIRTLASKSWNNNKTIHKRALKKSENQIRLGIAIFLYLIISWAIIQDDVKLGLSFIFAGALAIYAGHVYKGRQAMGLVLISVALASTLVPSFFPAIKDSFKQGDYVGMVILILFGVLFWYYSGQLKKGGVPVFEGKTSVKHRTKRGGPRRKNR